MLSTLLLLPLLSVAPLPGDAVADKIAEIGRDVDALWKLSNDYAHAGDEEASRAVAERIVRIDGDHEAARTALRHHRYGDQWFETYTALSKAMRAEAQEMWEEHGLVRFGKEWLPPADVPFHRMGWEQDAQGTWRSPTQVATVALEAQRTADGWEQQDLVWVPPSEFDPWREGLYKCGDDWLTAEEADTYHSEIGKWWEIAGENFIVQSTLDRESTRWAIWYADQVAADLQRLLGRKPSEKPTFVVLNSIPQYNTFAAGGNGRAATEASGASSVHYAFFADAWYDRSVQPPEFRGRGVSYWQRSDPNLEPYGQHAIRHAAAQSYLEAVDPSWDAVSKVVSGESQGGLGSFWNEKRLPTWLRYGAASYCERYFQDANAQEGGNPWWSRDWAIQNVATNGGVRELSDLFAFQLDANDPAGSANLIQEAGLLVSFLLDGDNKQMKKVHRLFVDALATGDADAIDEAIDDLEQALEKNRKALDEYAQS